MIEDSRYAYYREEQPFYTLSQCLMLPMSDLEKEAIPEEEENKDTEDASNEEPKE
ncbi:MAG: hypothetical protein WBV72_10375 [Nitrososphaeraceae archaeon]